MGRRLKALKQLKQVTEKIKSETVWHRLSERRGSELRSSRGGPFGGSGTQAGARWRASVVSVQAKVEMHCRVLDVGYLDGTLDSMC